MKSVQFRLTGRLLIVANRLPVSFAEDGTPIPTAGGLASALDGVATDSESLWIGWPGRAAEDIDDPDGLRDRMAGIGLRPVLLRREEVDGFYDGYANATLWPLLHNLLARTRFDPSWMHAYEAASRRFADEILPVAQQDDVVWIHDYHLFLLPGMLRQRGVRLRVGLFLHTPFPSSETFRVLPERRVVLDGMLGADLIGFHTFGYLRHFRSTLLRVLGIESEVDHLLHAGRTVRMGVHPIGHNSAAFEQAMADPTFDETLASYARDVEDRRLVLSVERLDYTKGLPQKLEAIARFLEKYAAWQDRVVFLLVAVPSRQGVEEYDQLTAQVQREVGAINGRFGTVGHAPIHFIHRGFPQEELAALYALADVCLATPLIDGMNLVAKEYIHCKRHPAARPGALVLSEFAGAAQEMSEAIQVNPYC